MRRLPQKKYVFAWMQKGFDFLCNQNPNCLPSIVNLFKYSSFVLSLLLSLGVSAQEQALVHTPKNVTVRRTLPPGVLPYGVAMPANFSKQPTDEEIYRVHFFDEPLVPMAGIKGESEENEKLVYALAGYSQRKSPDDFSSLLNFMNAYPKCRWNGALLLNLGIVYRFTGYYNQAFDAFQTAWTLMKDQTDKRAKPLADRAVTELLLMYAWTGRKDDIEKVLHDIDNRPLQGSAVTRIATMRAALEMMKHNPGISFKCGPYALNRLYMVRDSSGRFDQSLVDVQSPSQGFSLSQLQVMARQAGMNYQMAFREPGSPIIPKAVVHWKLNHYSALLSNDSAYVACQDPTTGSRYGEDFWLTIRGLDSSASGYFLVPVGALPKGWRSVSEGEGNQVYGKGYVPNDPGDHIGDDDEQSCTTNSKDKNLQPMAQSNVHLGPVSLHIFDRPLYYTPPIGPAVEFIVEYHQKETAQPEHITYSSMGQNWTFKYLSYIKDNPNNPSAAATLYMMGGGIRTFTGYNSQTSSYYPELQSKDVLVRTCANCYELRHNDGSKEIYERPDGDNASQRRVFLTQIVDITGNILKLSYDSLLRITALQDALGQVTLLSYDNGSDVYEITQVTDPFGRFAKFHYNELNKLDSITDMIGIVSSFHYADAEFIDQMKTPYGATDFIYKEKHNDSSLLETHYPMGEKERVEFKYQADALSSNGLPIPNNIATFNGNTYLRYRNTFYWDKKAMQDGPGDFLKAKVYHWQHGNSATGEDGRTSPILESVKEPNENRVWFNYQDQNSPAYSNQGMSPTPSKIARVLDDGTSQLTQYSYNNLGKVTSTTDPSKRTTTYKYDTSNINVIEIRQPSNGLNDLLAQYTYNAHHQPLTVTDASGQTTRFSYNDAGQLQNVTNPKNETTRFSYDGYGYLQTVTGPIAGTTVSFTYDGIGRVQTVTDPEGYIIRTDYDALDRPTVITYPDSTYEQIVYDRMDVVKSRDRLGRWTQTVYDSLDRPTKIIDAMGRINQFIWCNCGSLAQIIDPLNRITTFTRDLQGRLITKTYDDGKSINYSYEKTTSRLKEVVDTKGQKTQYNYFIDDNLKKIDYANALITTGSVSFAYDPNYNRIASMRDTTGVTNYTYNSVGLLPDLGANQLASIDGPLANDVILYNYDTLGRVNGRSINGVVSSVVFDALGRVTNAINTLGNFDYNYVNQTDRLKSIAMPYGLNTVFEYFNSKGDQRLREIWNKFGTSTISKFDYDYNQEGQIIKWTQQSGTASPISYVFDHDLVDQLLSAVLKTDKSPLGFKKFAYQYDSAGNRTMEQIDNSIILSNYNALNQLTDRKTAEPSRSNPTFPLIAPVIVTNSSHIGTDTILQAPTTTVPTSPYIDLTKLNDTLSYDDNGNTISTPGIVYGWDAVDRLVSITRGSNVTEFVYDGLSRRIAEKLNGIVIKRWLWDGKELAEERDTSGVNVVKRFFAQGEEINGVAYYFTKDHLGSIREMVDSSGVVQARYDYDPYGRKMKTYGTMEADFGFTGHYYHAASNLHLTLYRPYSTDLGRWLNRDPAQELGGLNLYGYVVNSPIKHSDLFGLTWWDNPGLFYDWVFENGSANRYYGQNDPATQELANSAGGDKIRKEFIDGGCVSGKGSFGSGKAFVESILDPFNGTQFQVGGYVYSYQDNNDGTVTYTIHNQLSVYSFFYHIPFLPHKKRGDWNINVPFYGTVPIPLFGNINQTFQWTESTSCSCGN